ncbi:PucR family transcriptional regulator [Pseudonocardia sichuanensis]
MARSAQSDSGELLMFEGIAAELRRQSRTSAEEIAEQVLATVPGYTAVTKESLRGSVAQHISTAAAALEAGQVPDWVSDVSVAAQRAREGVAIEHVLLAIRVSFEHLREFVLVLADDFEIDSADRLEALRLLWAVNDLVSREYAVAHRHEDLELARRAETHRAEFVRSLLTEGLQTPEMAMHADFFGLRAGAHRYRTFRARPEGPNGAAELLRDVLDWAGQRGLNPLGAVVDGDAAGVFVDSDELPEHLTLGVGHAVDLQHVHESFRVANRVLEVGRQFGREGPQTFEGLSLRLAVASEHALGDALVARLLAPLLERGDFGVLLLDTLDVYLAARMRTTDAARALVVHRNTLRYRINLIEKISEVSLQDPVEVAEVWWALRRHEWTTRTGYGAAAGGSHPAGSQPS